MGQSNGINSNGIYQTLVEHWDGTNWSIVTSPNPGTSSNDLNAVAAVSTSDVWAVGSYNNGSYKQTLVEHWNGTNWKVISSPNPGPQDNVLLGVAKVSGKNLWAVGTYYNPSSGLATQTLIEHWNGTNWKVVKSPNVVRTSVDVLFAVTAISASNIWAVGYHNQSVKTLIEHWNGTAWSIVKSPNYRTNPTVLAGVAASSANAVWAVGEVSYSSGPPSQTLTEFYC